MRLRLAYPDTLVEVNKDEVLVFNGKLLRAPLNEVFNYVYGRDAILPEKIKEIASDIVLAVSLMNSKVVYTHPVEGSSGVA
ncbi:hypothetical protein PAP_04665 [Palaeococcus pacificus DY20341]|uniref:Uncharacterized protein n=1 Tax=Palaeococcus pacificus DY20341 TaxID=1343739 RepID=A0A075LSQ9_9EURY|nr:hypothetical protein [Palaeococcus pacificus]AIF69344.1 hypothetical protein PAP_04665 [Palaeococcus pacificus DY20341]